MTIHEDARGAAAVTAGPREASSPSAPAGWYPDSLSPGVLRYWDGAHWTDYRAPAQAPVYAPYASGQPVVPDIAVPSACVVTGPAGDLTFAGHRICTPGERLGAYLLDGLLMLVTLYIGWLIWACVTAGEGQTPGKRLLGQRVYRLDTGSPATFGWMLGMRGCVGGMVFGMSFYVLVGFVLMFMPFWDRKNQTVVDKISSTVVVSEQRS